MSITSSTEPHGENIVLISFSSQSPSVVRPFPWSTRHLMPMERDFISSIRLSSCCGGPDPLPDEGGREEGGERSGTMPPA